MRPSWNVFFFSILDQVKTRSTCRHRQASAILVRDNSIISTGYNGAPGGLSHCIDKDYCNKERYNLCVATHAEINAIVNAAKQGVSTENSILYTEYFPCYDCMKVIINAGIVKIIYRQEYVDDNGSLLSPLSRTIADLAGIGIEHFDE